MIMGMTTFLTYFDEIRSQLTTAPSPKRRVRSATTSSGASIDFCFRSGKNRSFSVPRNASDEEKFFARVEKKDGHWLWMGYVDKDGYGRFLVSGKTRGAHQWSYENFVRVLETGEVVDHLCRIRSCVNPECLEAVTNEENVRRGHAARTQRDRTHCSEGHLLEGNNLRVNSRGYRLCLKCTSATSERSRINYYRNRERVAQDLNQPIVTCVNGHTIQPDWLRCKTCHSERARLARQLRKKVS